MNEWSTIVSIPLIAALIGWFTNYIAVKMIFRPRRPIKILGLRFQGLLPRRQYEIAESIGETVARDLVSHEDVKAALSNVNLSVEMHALIDQQVDKFLIKFPMLGMFLQGDALAQVKDGFKGEMDLALPGMLKKVMQGVETNLDFKSVVSARIQSFDLSKLEEIVYRISARELKAIEYLGGVLGFLVGLLQLLVIR